ncbi:hypothetical protein ES288_D02G141700v1 [Gossypium darwinii]|uniref:Uncharacterized protein n=1 Tax=Gossypium darwinii TaxID=34276 RepID=A0A5D2DDL4_GOSDA|nr:hypothetical protein ES288_D02G141700v1 [Gossypium darwinii]
MLNQDIRKARVIKYGFNGKGVAMLSIFLIFFLFILLLYSRIQNHFPFNIISLLIFA